MTNLRRALVTTLFEATGQACNWNDERMPDRERWGVDLLKSVHFIEKLISAIQAEEPPVV